MSKYKNLHIDKEKVEEQINEFCASKGYTCRINSKIINPATNQCRYTIDIAIMEFIVDFYFRNDGKTTLMPLGSNEELLMSTELCEYIYNSVEYLNVASGSFSVSLDRDKFNLLIDYLKSIKGVDLVKNENVNNNIGQLYQFHSNIGDNITLTYYESSGNLLFQGYIMKLYTEIKCYLSPFTKVTTKVKNVKDLDKLKIQNNLKRLLPSSYDKIDDLLKEFISDSLMQIMYRVPCNDYSVWAFSALKSLEGYIKRMLSDNKIHIKDKAGFCITVNVAGKYETKPIFIFNRTLGKYEVDKILVGISDTDVCDALSDCYSYFNANRHVLFHTKQTLKATRVLKDSSIAEEIVYRVCDLIENSYKKINKV